MKPWPLLSLHSRHQSQRGIALIIVLGCLIFLSALLLAFLSSVKTELISSKVYADNAAIHSLVDSSVNIVMSQIRQATTTDTEDCWTSQPGLIRTFDNTGVPDRSYKLYSSDTMQMEGALNPATEASQLTGWHQKTAVYTDLNQSVSGVYPILTPSSTTGVNAIQGFNVSSAPTTTLQPVPMPVRWLYVLNDGSLVAPTPVGSGSTATINGATADNAIVGRIAFWTDDETCKVNINTASEGTYWDVPHFHNATDRNLGIYQPVKNEFQSYPGHPAGVSLSTIFPFLAVNAAGHEYDAFYHMTPRIQTGGSLNGTVGVSTNATPVTLDANRLYTGADELIFSNSFSGTARIINAGLTEDDIERAKFFITASSRSPETTPFGTPKVVCWPIHSAMASNPATPLASAFDRLIGLCGTVNRYLYYFQRQNKNSSTDDYDKIARNQQLYAYLQNLMSRPVPGFGGTLATKFGTDKDQILTEIFEYIRCTNLNDLNLTSTSSQFGAGTTSRGYGQAEVAPIVIGDTRGFGRFVTFTEAALWLICTADPTVTSTPASNAPENLTLAPDPSNPSKGLLLTSTPTSKQIRIEAALILDPFTPVHGATPMRPDVEVLIDGLNVWTIQGNTDSAPANFKFPSLTQQTYTDAGIYQLGVSPDWTNAMYNMGGYMGADWALNNRKVRARNSGRLPVDPKFSESRDGGSGPLNRQYPFVSEPITLSVKPDMPNLAFSGGTIHVTIRQRTTGTVIQTLTFQFPPSVLPAPTLATNTNSNNPNPADRWTFQASGCGLSGSKTGRFLCWSEIRQADPNTGPMVETNYDVIYSMVAQKGGQTLDPRFVAMTKSNMNGDLFDRHPYYDGVQKIANTIISNPISGLTYNRNGVGNTGTLANLGGKFYPTYFWPCPKVPYPAEAAVANGDWDNGVGDLADGGFVNAPDQGNIDSSYATPYFTAHTVASTSFTSPSRMIPSPGMFGSLPTGFKRDQGWQTLLFRRQPSHPSYAAANGSFINNPDYLMLDFFWMPVVEPYAISEPLSTSGKINMNYQIVPFTYIERSTGLHAALKHEKVISVPTADYNKVYKAASSYGPSNYRRNILIPETLTQFQQRFTNADGTGLYAFRTPSEICDVHLIPDDARNVPTANKASIDTAMATYWSTHTLTGDNTRERPYTTLYPRLTTRSNTYRVHYRVQTLKTAGAATPSQWREDTDLVTGEGRGSILIERFVDPSDSRLPDYATNPTASLEPHYQFRILSSSRFAP